MNSERIKNYWGSLVRRIRCRLASFRKAGRSPEDEALPEHPIPGYAIMEESPESLPRVLLSIVAPAILAAAIAVGFYFTVLTGGDGLTQEAQSTPAPTSAIASPTPAASETASAVATASPTPTPPPTASPTPTPPPTATPVPVPPPTDLTKVPGFPVVIDEKELYVADAESGESRLVLRTTGWISEPLWSPDGTKIAFRAHSPTGHGDIYIADLSGSVAAPKIVLSGDEEWWFPSFLWSSDGSQLVVLGTSSGAPDHYAASIQVVDVEDGETTEVYSEEAASHFQLDLMQWLSNGNRVLAVRDGDLVTVDMSSGELTTIHASDSTNSSWVRALSPDESQVVLAVLSEDEECDEWRPAMRLITVSVADGTEAEMVSDVCEITHVAWSPDGSEISFTVIGGESGAYVVNVASGETRRLTDPGDERFDIHSEWLADGSGLVVRRTLCWGCCGGGGDWLFVPVAGGSEEVLTSASWLSGFGGFAPDSQRYLYSDDALRIRTLDGEETVLTEPDAASAYFGLTWSPDGDRVAYSRIPSDHPRRYALDIETRDLTALPAPAESTLLFEVSPDGTMAAFTRTAEQRDEVWKLQLLVSQIDGTDERLLVDAHVTSFRWSADSRQIAYILSGDRTVLHLVDVATGDVREVASLNGWQQISSWSPDGAYLALIGEGGALSVIEMATGSDVLVAQATGQTQWSPDGRRLVYEAGPYAERNIAVFDVVTGESQQLTGSPGADTAPSWSPEGDRIAFWRQLNDYPDEPIVGLYLLTIDTLEEQEVARFEGFGAFGGSGPVWSPDGSNLAVLRSSGSTSAIYLVAVDSSEIVQLTAMSGRQYEHLSWSADGRRLTFSSLYVGL